MTVLALIVALAAGASAAGPGEAVEPTSAQVRDAVDRGIDYLLKDQNADGSWGGPQDSITTWSGEVWSNPETHRAWKVAVTGLCLSALLETTDTDQALAAADRALAYLIDNADVKRPSDWDTMNNWAYIFGLQGLCTAAGNSRYAISEHKPKIAQAVPKYLHNLARFQSVNGGWGYLELDPPRTRRPQWATSFMTASAIVALESARQQGFDIDDNVLHRAVRVLQRCKLPNGAYTYRVRTVPNLHSEYIDQIKGSLCRIQVCQAALLATRADVPQPDRLKGLQNFFTHHKFIDVAMHKPIPHETLYYNSGYFYLYGHYYCALVIESLPLEQQTQWWPRLQREIIKTQQKDGSMWDYDMHRYDKPYGIAFGIMALQKSLPPQQEHP